MFTNPLTCVMNNNKWHKWFSPTRGTRQGCTYSPSIFILVVEMLGLGIRQNKYIEGIKLITKSINLANLLMTYGQQYLQIIPT